MIRILAALVLISFTTGTVMADLFQDNNPFGRQTNSNPNLNNIYDTTPAAMEQDKETTVKVKKSKWWKVSDEVENEAKTPVHQRAEDSGFIIFK